jgi:hypothetical protein
MKIIGTTADRGGDYLVQISETELRRVLGLKYDERIPSAGVTLKLIDIIDAALAVVNLQSTIKYHAERATAAIEDARTAAEKISAAVQPPPPAEPKGE